MSRAASEIMDARFDKHEAWWREIDACAALEDACGGDTLLIRQVCEAELPISHSDIRAAARKSRQWPPDERDPLYSPAAHNQGMKRRNQEVS